MRNPHEVAIAEYAVDRITKGIEVRTHIIPDPWERQIASLRETFNAELTFQARLTLSQMIRTLEELQMKTKTKYVTEVIGGRHCGESWECHSPLTAKFQHSYAKALVVESLRNP